MNFEPVEVLNPSGAFPAVVAVDHAGALVPPDQDSLGLTSTVLRSHHALDRGAAAVALQLAEQLDVTVVLCHASRLVIDCNRWIEDPRSVLTHAGEVAIPGNQTLSQAARKVRQDQIFWPYHRAIANALGRRERAGRRPMLLALHSFVRIFDGLRRPWDAGTLWHEDEAMAAALRAVLSADASLVIGDNVPYSGLGGVYTIDRHSFGQGIAGCGLEIADDGLATEPQAEAWAARLTVALQGLAAQGFAA